MRPRLTIKYGKLLEPFFHCYIEQKYPGFEIPDEAAVKAKVRLFRNEWSRYRDRFFDGIESFGLEFSRNRIDVHVVSATDRDMSSPLIMRSRYDAREFVSVLFHELLHNLFGEVGLVRGYGEETSTSQRHVYVFAMLEFLFRDVMGEPERIEEEKGKSGPGRNPEYYRAWEIVERDGYHAILEGMETRQNH